MGRLARGWFVALISLVGAAAFVGCADPEGELKEFASRCKDQVNRGDFDGGTTCDPVIGACSTECTTVGAGVIDGKFFFTLSASIADDIPLVFSADVTTSDNAGTLEMTWVLQPLEKADRKTPVGDPITLGPMPVTDGGLKFIAEGVGVEGPANPISGSPIETEALTLLSCPPEMAGGAGGLCELSDFYCGTIPTGTVTKPAVLDIGGSTWTMVRVESDADYPEPPPINCAKKLAKSVNDL